jgi:hypothetical protein
MIRAAWLRLLAFAEGLRTTGDELREQLASVREQVLDENALLERDGADLAARIRRNARSGRGVFGGPRP